jgi:ribosomal protein S14
MPSHPESTGERSTFRVPDELFRAVYESPRSLPGEHVWLTPDEDVREIERILGIEERAIGAPLWLSGDERECRECGRETSWLDIVSSALTEVHRKQLIVTVVLGEQKFVNVEVPRAIAGLRCHKCGTPIETLRSFKCHNWAYARGDLAKIVEQVGGRV